MRTGCVLHDCNFHVLIRDHNGELSHCSIRPVYSLRLTHPDLIPIAQEIIRSRRVHLRLRCGIYLLRYCRTDKVLCKDSFPVPYAAIHIKLHQAEIVLKRRKKPRSAGFNAIGGSNPLMICSVDSNLLIEILHQKLMHPHSGFLLHNCRQHGGSRRVIHERCSRLIHNRHGQEIADPVFGRLRFLSHSAAHAKDIANRQLFQVFRRIFRCFLRENINQPFVQ